MITVFENHSTIFQKIEKHLLNNQNRYLGMVVSILVLVVMGTDAFSQTSIPSLSINVGQTDDPSQ